MAVLPDANRVKAWERFMRENLEGVSITKPDLRAAINGVDDWVDANATSFNNAFPQPAKGSLTAKQKALILLYVVNERFGVI